MSLMKRRYLFEEGEEDNQSSAPQPTVNGGDNAGGDDGGDTDEDYSVDAEPEEDNNDDNADDADNNNEDQGDDNEDETDEDYSVDSEPDEDGGEDTEGGDDSGTDDTSSTDTEEEKELDRELFNSLSESEKKRKIAELKRLFYELYGKCDSLVEKFNQVSDEYEEEFTVIVKRIIKVLYTLKQYISYYLLHVFDDASYIENDIQFNRYLCILNGVKLTVEELKKVDEEEKK